MTRFVFLFAVILALTSTARAQTSPSCANLPNVVCATAADTLVGPLTFDGAGAGTPFIFEGTPDAFETTVVVTDPTVDRTVTIPNADSATATSEDCSPGNHLDSFDAATGLFGCTADTGGTNALLDNTAHTDTTASTVTRGDLIVGNATPAWDDLPIGAAATFLRSDGTDPAWTAIAAADIGAGDIANALTWSQVCTASPCTLANAPRVSTGTSPTLLVTHHGLTMRPVASCGSVGEVTISSTTLTFCGEAPSTGVDSALAFYER
jgi:hypothetical protein